MIEKSFNQSIIKAAVVSLLILFSCVAATIFYLDFQEKKQEVVQVENVKKGTIFFYRDDCPDCQKIFKQVFILGAIDGNQKNINLNQEKNRKYISDFNIDQVPTIFKNGKRYEGLKEIEKFLDQESIF